MVTDEIASSWKKAMNSIRQNGRKEMLTDEQASSWKKAKNSIQQNRRKEMLTDDQASSWKTMNSIQHHGNKEMLKFRAERSNDLNSTECKKRTSRANKLVAERKQWNQLNQMEERKCSQTDKLLADRKQ